MIKFKLNSQAIHFNITALIYLHFYIFFIIKIYIKVKYITIQAQLLNYQ